MAEKGKKSSPPYATFAPFLNFINKLRGDTIPGQIDPSLFGNASGSIIYSVIGALKSLKLVDENGTPSAQFVEFVQAKDEDRPSLFREILKSGYPSLFSAGVDLSSMTPLQFDNHLQQEFGISGSTVDKAAAFFISGAKFAEVPLSKHLQRRTPRFASQSSRRSARQRTKSDASAPNNEAPAPPPLEASRISEKALEYRLVDLMTEAANDPEVMAAIIKVITFLKTRDASPPSAVGADEETEEGS